MEADMSNNTLPKGTRKVKSYLTSPFLSHKLCFRPGALKNIMVVKGWKNYQEVADGLGFTRQYICLIANGGTVSSEFITRMALATNNIDGKWHTFYQIVPKYTEVDPNHPSLNMEKYYGRIPYTKYSEQSNLRRRDYKTEDAPDGAKPVDSRKKGM